MHMTKFAMLIFLYQPKKFRVLFFTFLLRYWQLAGGCQNKFAEPAVVFEQVARNFHRSLGAWIGAAFLIMLANKFFASLSDFDKKSVIANQAHHFPIAVERIFSKHFASVHTIQRCKLIQNIIDS